MVGGGESARSVFTGLDTAPERLEYRLATVRLDAGPGGTRLGRTEQVTFLRYTGHGSTDLAHLRGGSVRQLNGLDAVLRSTRT
ncbi:hypothetical protein Jiend_29610 [Micromonospora endophytica]|nr:hypothetical protein Jiend_29610 [Micromonospora endophytica]